MNFKFYNLNRENVKINKRGFASSRMLGAALKRYYNDAKVIPPAAISNGDFTASLLYRFNIDESDIVVICKIMSLSDIALVLISVDR